MSTELFCLGLENNEMYKITSAVISKLTGLAHYSLRAANVLRNVGPVHLRKVKQQKRKTVARLLVHINYLILSEFSVLFKYCPMKIFWPQPWLSQVVFLFLALVNFPPQSKKCPKLLQHFDNVPYPIQVLGLLIVKQICWEHFDWGKSHLKKRGMQNLESFVTWARWWEKEAEQEARKPLTRRVPSLVRGAQKSCKMSQEWQIYLCKNIGRLVQFFDILQLWSPVASHLHFYHRDNFCWFFKHLPFVDHLDQSISWCQLTCRDGLQNTCFWLPVGKDENSLICLPVFLHSR